MDDSFNYLLTLEYDGGGFHGWQSQKGLKAVQATLEKALFDNLRQEICIFGAGRTDTGVHAEGQAASFFLKNSICLDRLVRGTNFYLKNVPLRVLSAQAVPSSFHARFSAIQRFYRYRILNRAVMSPLKDGRVWWIAKRLDLRALCEAAAQFVGHHNFGAFRGRFCQSATPFKTMDVCEAEEIGDEVHIFVKSRSFLHHQVRLMVGTLAQVGLGRLAPSDVVRLLQEGQRGTAGPKAPAQGLCLTEVVYPAAAFKL